MTEHKPLDEKAFVCDCEEGIKCESFPPHLKFSYVKESIKRVMEVIYLVYPEHSLAREHLLERINKIFGKGLVENNIQESGSEIAMRKN